jgi:hypothetical protein
VEIDSFIIHSPAGLTARTLTLIVHAGSKTSHLRPFTSLTTNPFRKANHHQYIAGNSFSECCVLRDFERGGVSVNVQGALKLPLVYS